VGVRHTEGQRPRAERHTDAGRPKLERPVDPRGPLTTETVSTLQRLAGNRAVAALMSVQRRPAITLQRDPPTATMGTSITEEKPPDSKGVDGGGIANSTDSGGTTGSTDTGGTAQTGEKGKTEEAAKVEVLDSTVAPEMERDATPLHPPPTRPGFDLAGGQEILTKAFGKVKTIVPGKIEVLDQAAFEAAYDKIYGAGDYSWAKYVKPKYGSLNGFAHDGVNYINKASAGLHTIVHEMLHNNTAGDWRGVVGSRWDEGTTEVLTQIACKLFDEPAPVCYPGESPVVQVALDSGLPVADLQDAYLSGGAQKKIAGWVDDHCVLRWAKVKEKMEAQDWAAAKAGLAPKKSIGQRIRSWFQSKFSRGKSK